MTDESGQESGLFVYAYECAHLGHRATDPWSATPPGCRPHTARMTGRRGPSASLPQLDAWIALRQFRRGQQARLAERGRLAVIEIVEVDGGLRRPGECLGFWQAQPLASHSDEAFGIGVQYFFARRASYAFVGCQYGLRQKVGNNLRGVSHRLLKDTHEIRVPYGALHKQRVCRSPIPALCKFISP
jgi:hypothetical protein